MTELKTLIDAKKIRAGKNVIKTVYLGETVTADLCTDGLIFSTVRRERCDTLLVPVVVLSLA